MKCDQRASFRRVKIPFAKTTPSGRQNQTPDATATDNITPYVTSAAANAAKTASAVPTSE
jgi:hypothetical protein